MKKNRYIWGCVLVIIVMTLTLSRDIDLKKNMNIDRFSPQVLSKNEIVLFNRYNHNIVTYDTKKKLITQWNDDINLFQYEFNTQTDLYTSGHSTDNGFKILKLENNSYEIMYSLNENEAIFPLASNGEVYFFMHSFYDKYGAELLDKRTISLFDEKEKKLHDYKNTNGLISYGTFYDNKLFYTTYQVNSDTYDLYSLDFSDIEDEPILIEKGLENGKIFVSIDGLWKSNNDYIYNKDKKLSIAKLNYIDKDSDSLIQIDVNNGQIYLKVIDIKTEKEYLYFNDVIDFKIYNGEITVYGDKYIETKNIMVEKEKISD
ncbi:MAG: hypothetical protein ACRCXT_11890 [Paraclostridium sp.]